MTEREQYLESELARERARNKSNDPYARLFRYLLIGFGMGYAFLLGIFAIALTLR